MANYHEDIINIDLESGNLFRSFAAHQVGEGDVKANRFGVRVFRSGTAEDISGSTCTGYFIRPTGDTVVISGTVSGNKAYVTLPEACYTYEGQFSLAIKLSGGGVTGTMRIVDGMVVNTTTDTLVDPGTIIPSVEALIAAIDAAVASIPADYSSLLEAFRTTESMSYNVPVNLDTTIQSGTLSTETGAAIENEARSRTGYISVKPNGSYYLKLNSTDYRFTSVAWLYGSNSDASATRKLDYVGYNEIVLKTQSTENYLRVTFCCIDPSETMTDSDREAIAEALVMYEYTDTSLGIANVPADSKAVGDKLQEQETMQNANFDLQDIIDKRVGLFDYMSESMIDGYAVISGDYGSDLNASANYKATPLIRFREGCMFLSTGDSNSSYSTINFYDKNKELISSHSNNIYNRALIAPEGTEYLRLSRNYSLSAYDVFVMSESKQEEIRSTKQKIQARAYGFYNNRAIAASTGQIIDTSGESVRRIVTAYIPVEAKATILNLNYGNSASYGHAFYDENLDYLDDSAIPDNSDNAIILVPDGAKFVRFTLKYEDNDELYYIPKDCVIWEINVNEFGILGNRSTDVVKELQVLFDYAGQNGANVYLPSGDYYITKSLQINYRNMLVYGDDWKIYAPTIIRMKVYEQTVNQDGTITYTEDGNGHQVVDQNPVLYGIIVRRTATKIKFISFRQNAKSRETSWSDTQNLIGTGVYYLDSVSDIDGKLINCHFDALNRGVYVSGKNLEIAGNTFSHCNIGVELFWTMRRTVEQREININSNRFHSCGRNTYGKQVAYDKDRICIKFPENASAYSSRAFDIGNNFADYCGVFISGNLFGANIHDNTNYLSRGEFIRSSVERPTPSGTGTVLIGEDLFGGSVPAEDQGIDVSANTITIVNRSGFKLTPVIPVTEGELISIKFSYKTSSWGHGFVNENGVLFDGILGREQGDFVVPSGAVGIRLTVKESDIESSEMDIYEGYELESIATESYASKTIIISDNNICGAVMTDYSPGKNILESAIVMSGYKNIDIDSNVINNGVDNVISVTDCDNVIIEQNKFISSPSYCEVFDGNGDLESVEEGTGKHYIMLDNCNGYMIYSNTGIHGVQYDGTDEPYVTVPVVDGEGDPITVDASNHFN